MVRAMVRVAQVLCLLLAVGNCCTDCTNVLYEAWCILTGKAEFSLFQLEHLQDSVAVQVRAIGKENVQRPKPTCGYILLQLPLILLPGHCHCKQLPALK